MTVKRQNLSVDFHLYCSDLSNSLNSVKGPLQPVCKFLYTSVVMATNVLICLSFVAMVTVLFHGALIYSGRRIMPVFISTWGDGGYNRTNFQLTASLLPSHGITALDGMLCENGSFYLPANAR